MAATVYCGLAAVLAALGAMRRDARLIGQVRLAPPVLAIAGLAYPWAGSAPTTACLPFLWLAGVVALLQATDAPTP